MIINCHDYSSRNFRGLREWKFQTLIAQKQKIKEQFNNNFFIIIYAIVIYLTNSCVILAFFGMSGPVSLVSLEF
jgi:hypothetical protein